MKEEGYLGIYAKDVNLLKVGDYQSMVFSPDDDGPIYLSPTERQSKKEDRDTGKIKTVKYTLSELINKLKEEKNVIVKGNLKK